MIVSLQVQSSWTIPVCLILPSPIPVSTFLVVRIFIAFPCFADRVFRIALYSLSGSPLALAPVFSLNVIRGLPSISCSVQSGLSRMLPTNR